ncbi:MAG: DUF3987 domain-containing protein, partial [Synechococcaceae cyanobacterium SM2_3_1]|nr:DUF3987 domain-containing protein [Synechococcaceae cyanobacterium SM2_3_1]
MRLEELLEKNLDQASRQATLLDLAAEYGRSLREVEPLLEAIETTHEYEEALAETSDRFQELIALESKKLDLHRVLPKKIADPMLARAEAMPTTTAALLTTFIPTAGSQIGTSARIVIKASSGYTQPCIFRTALVANTGDRKTPTQRAIVDPLYALESKAFQEWQAKQLAYQQAMEDPFFLGNQAVVPNRPRPLP